ncbi:hypothetical protein [Kerstersia gyiorum]|uniref:hypothetical protein n=1 Tax=Kerstersia gyiorum TaxID=206506 RepID=UPI00209D6E07|nr:hypothetical protein [Kerstersia gyiorum]MCP1679432.1 hypothetical protein [Kerstersia gyiorum]MCP1823935.1 hypothetical protein [Kerstersia gyiorum]MCP1827376.1 hypothetical protein [Kerstersia gyiorum]MCW2448975.1 hypothetical protein [Kerstersia gyiorum]
MDDDLRKETLEALAQVAEAQGFALGQIQALEVALGACFVALRDQPEFLASVKAALEGRTALVHQHEKSLSVRDGFDSMSRSMLRYMGADQPGPVHRPPSGNLN